MDMMALAIEMFHGFRADETAGTGNPKLRFGFILKSLLSPFEIGPATNIMRQISRI